jgi:transposase-like protein/IS1 family transposase
MDPATTFCPHPACPARGQTGQGNIPIHSCKDKRFLGTECHKTFSATQGTAFYRLRTSAETVSLVVTLMAHGCPRQAIVVAFGYDERTVACWLARAGVQGQVVQEHLVEPPRDLGQVQADESRVKTQGGRVWLALAMRSKTRLWLAGEVSEQRDRTRMRRLIARVRLGALHRPLVFCTDGWCSYIRAIRETFRAPVRTGEQGRPRLRPWRNLCIAQVVKRYVQRRVVDVERRIVAGTPARVETLRRRSHGAGVINTAYIERRNATFREPLASLTRRGRALARHPLTLQHGMYLIGTVYNCCTPHTSLRLAASGGGGRCLQRTPAMAAGITDRCWSVQERLSYHVPPPRWTPPTQRGRPSHALKRLIERWCRDHG